MVDVSGGVTQCEDQRSESQDLGSYDVWRAEVKKLQKKERTKIIDDTFWMRGEIQMLTVSEAGIRLGTPLST
jgi:hypothetical protein